MIPENVSSNDILKAVEQIDRDGIPKDRHSTKWSVQHNDTLYPPKYLLSLANLAANGKILSASDFSGGDEANHFLEKLGFTILPFGTRYQDYPFETHSWTLISDTVAIKKLDKSSFLHHGSGIPFELRPFFCLKEFEPSDAKGISFDHKGNIFSAKFVMDKDLRRIRLFWKADFETLLRNKFPDLHQSYHDNEELPFKLPRMRLEKASVDGTRFKVEFLYRSEIESDVDSEISEEYGPGKEGTVKKYFGKRYERDAGNRNRAIEIHGAVCKICGFDFESRYGDRGKGFIEVHHTKPLSELKEEYTPDLKKDLIPVCSNCHRMIHRRQDNVLGIDEMRIIVNS